MQFSSLQNSNGYEQNTVALPIGKTGLDLREPVDQTALTQLINAQFIDEKTIARRTGHTRKFLQDGADFPAGIVTSDGDWTYGHGQAVTVPLNVNPHYPIHRQNLLTFRDNERDVSWTGDRLLVHQNGTDKCLGGSTYWWKAGVASPPLFYGMPCYLPSVTDIPPVIQPTGVAGTDDYYDACISSTNQCIVYVVAGDLYAQITDRATGSLIAYDKLNGISGTTNTCAVRCIVSGNYFVVTWRDIVSGLLYYAFWNGVTWAGTTMATCSTYDLDQLPGNGGGLLVWRNGSAIVGGYISGNSSVFTPVAFGTTISTTGGGTPNGRVGVAVTPDGLQVGIVWNTTTGTYGRVLHADLSAYYGTVLVDSATANPSSLSLVSLKLQESGDYRFAVYVSNITSGQYLTRINTLYRATVSTGNTKFNSVAESRAFRVGNECFQWMMSTNSPVHYLVAGYSQPIVCGYADRGYARNAMANVQAILPSVSPDPNSNYKFVWGRERVVTYPQQGTMVISYMDFLPDVSTAKFGKSVYLSGSAVQCFDGYEVSDAGFQDYPTTASGVNAAGGALSAGDYFVRVYAVRYNRRGEKFISPALTSPKVTAAASDKITWTINTVPSVTSPNVIFEVYRTQAGGTAFYYEGTVLNANSATVTFVTTIADTVLGNNPADIYAAQLGGAPQLFSWGPTGCKILLAHNDRLWGAGGQVPAGRVIFSKLKEDVFGAGFDSAGGYIVEDAEGGTITSLASLNDAVVVFEKDRFYLQTGEGPDNYGRGGFPSSHVLLAKGAVNHKGTALTDIGIVYWNSAGPYLLSTDLQAVNISEKVRPLSETLIPTGVRVDATKKQIVWFTSSGNALLWDYTEGNSRWAQWTNLFVSSASPSALSLTNGYLFIPDSTVYNDGGQQYIFSFKTSNIRPENLLQGSVLLRRIGMVGRWIGPHTVRIRVYYNGSPMWEDEETWDPAGAPFALANTWLNTIYSKNPNYDYSTALPNVLDGTNWLDKSGGYSIHRRVSRSECQRFQVEYSDTGSDGPTFIPEELTFELGVKPGLGRTPVATLTP